MGLPCSASVALLRRFPVDVEVILTFFFNGLQDQATNEWIGPGTYDVPTGSIGTNNMHTGTQLAMFERYDPLSVVVLGIWNLTSHAASCVECR